ncbi:MAG TPA: hypothetical protein VEX68_24930 [Bryobacteraceae bacterium]|nr:hypothetical protein [Bryobacteraceae bacterium]
MSNKAEIARANGAKSNGPITAEGKAISSRNSLKHGLTSSRVVLAHESQEEYDALELSFLRRFKPADEVETELVIEMAASRWRLRRIELMEDAVFKKAMREQAELLGPDADPAEIRDAAYVYVAESKTMRTLASHSRQLRRSYERAWKELEGLQNQRKQELENEPTVRSTQALQSVPVPSCTDQTRIPAPYTIASKPLTGAYDLRQS